MWSVLVAVCALAGTVMQALAALRELSMRDPEIVSALAIHDLKHEVHRWQLVAWSRHQRIVRSLMVESEAEAASYRRLWIALWSWSLLSTSAAMATFVAAVSLVR